VVLIFIVFTTNCAATAGIGLYLSTLESGHFVWFVRNELSLYKSACRIVLIFIDLFIIGAAAAIAHGLFPK